jgi:type IV pilus assembly protein PilC
MLMEVSEYLETHVEEKVQLLTTAIEPAVMILMGVVVGGVIIAMYLPIFKIAGTVGG